MRGNHGHPSLTGIEWTDARMPRRELRRTADFFVKHCIFRLGRNSECGMLFMTSTMPVALDMGFANFINLELRKVNRTIKRNCRYNFRVWEAVCEFSIVFDSCSCFTHGCRPVIVDVVAMKNTSIHAGQSRAS